MRKIAAIVAVLAVGLASAPVLSQDGRSKSASRQLSDGEQIVEDIVAWVNDDIIVKSEIDLNQRDLLSGLIEQGLPEDQLERRFKEMTKQVYLQSIWSRLLVQEAERLYDIDGIADDLVRQFMERNQIDDVATLEQLTMRELQMDLEGLKDRLVLAEAPRYVIQSQIMGQMGLSNDEIRAHYDKNIDRFTTAGSVTFREIVLEGNDREQEAREIAGRARGAEGTPPTDFIELVKEKSEVPSKAIDGRIGPLDPNDLIPEIRNALADLEVGSISEPIKTDIGWHVLKVEQAEAARVAPFEEVKDRCEAMLRDERFAEANEEYVTKLWEDGAVEIREEYAEFLPDEWLARTTVR